MAFKINPNPTFWHPCQITVPGEEKPATVKVEFRHKTKEQLSDFFERIKTTETPLTDADLLEEVIVGWEVEDSPYSVENLKALLNNYPASGMELAMQYTAALTESRRKNLPR